MKSENLMIMVLLILLIGGTMVFCIYKVIGKGRDRGKEYASQQKSTFVQNGVDVKKQMLGSQKGAFFSANLEDCDTYYINGVVYPIWEILFRNIDTGEVFKYRFRKQMSIGRIPSPQQGEIRLVLPDEKVSRNQCIIYEGKGGLFLSDENSRNHTCVNEEKINGSVLLNNGNVIKVGDTRLEIAYGK